MPLNLRGLSRVGVEDKEGAIEKGHVMDGEIKITGHHLDAMKAMLDLAKAIEDGLLSVNGIADVIREMVESGHEMLAMCLCIASMAASKVSEERGRREVRKGHETGNDA